MSTKRLRMFAGPNGSGKSTVFNDISKKFQLGTYLNADEIEKQLQQNHRLDLRNFHLDSSSGSTLDEFLADHSLYKKATSRGYKINLKFEENFILNFNAKTHSYEAAILADFLRNMLIEKGRKLTFETVMSHPSKLDTLRKAKEMGYKNYLYFICTENPEINKSRVAERVLKGGHDVPPQKTEERYYRSLALLKEAVALTHRTFIFDNSEEKSTLILDIYHGNEVTYRTKKVPLWVDEYLLNTAQ